MIPDMPVDIVWNRTTGVKSAYHLHGVQEDVGGMLGGEIWQVVQEDGEAHSAIRVEGLHCVVCCV